MVAQDYKYALSVTSQFYFCGMPFRLDITPKCALNCLYCFAMARGGRKTSNELLLNYKSFEKKIVKNLESNQYSFDINGEFLRRRQPLHFGGMSDPFSTKQTTEITLKCLKLLNKYNYPILLSTKNTSVFHQEDILEAVKNGNVVVQISFSCLDKNKAIVIEPNIPTPEERIKVIEILSNEGIHVIARIQPILTIWLKEIEQKLIPTLGESGCKHIITEFLKIPVERKASMISCLIKALDWDVYDAYKKFNAKLVGREWILPNEKKLELLNSLIKITHSRKMTFSCGDYGLNHIGDTRCCCGIDNIEGFQNWFKGNMSNLLHNIGNKEIFISKLDKEWYPNKSISWIINSNCRMNSNKMKDYIINKWNRPNTANSIDSYYGIDKTPNFDKYGNVVFVNNLDEKYSINFNKQ